MLLNREALLTRDKLEIVKVEFENGDYVCVRAMTGHERDVFEQSVLKAQKNEKGKLEYQTVLEDFRAKLAVVTLCDEQGNLLLKSTDVSALSNAIGASKLEKIVNEAQKLNGITEEDKEGLVKNSVAGQAGNSTSDSAEN